MLFSPMRARSSVVDLESNASWTPRIQRTTSTVEKKTKSSLMFMVLVLIGVISMSCFVLVHNANSHVLIMHGTTSSENSKGLTEKQSHLSSSEREEHQTRLINAALKDRIARVSAPKINKLAPKKPPEGDKTDKLALSSVNGDKEKYSDKKNELDSSLKPLPLQKTIVATTLVTNGSNASAILSAKASCVHNYGGALHDCDYWVRTQGNTCTKLATDNGFDCAGCLCDMTVLAANKGCIDYGGELHSCDFWLSLNQEQTCKELEEQHNFDCSGCKCQN